MAAMAFREPNQVRWVGTRPGHNGTQVIAGGTATNTVTILWTVTAGKTLHITYFSLAMRSGAVTAECSISVRNGADVYQYSIVNIGTVASDHGELAAALSVPIEVPAGYDVYVASDSANLKAYGTIHGWEE